MCLKPVNLNEGMNKDRGLPVLSEQITEMEPSASTEWSFLTIALRFAMRNTPRASVTVVTTGSPSGMAATANDTIIEEDKPILWNHKPMANLRW